MKCEHCGAELEDNATYCPRCGSPQHKNLHKKKPGMFSWTGSLKKDPKKAQAEPPRYEQPKYEPPKYEQPKYEPPKHEQPNDEPPDREPDREEAQRPEPQTQRSENWAAFGGSNGLALGEYDLFCVLGLVLTGLSFFGLNVGFLGFLLGLLGLRTSKKNGTSGRWMAHLAIWLWLIPALLNSLVSIFFVALDFML